MRINWYVGLKRLSYVFLALVWITGLAVAYETGPAQLGYIIAMLLMFTLGYMVFFMFIAWALRGFLVPKNTPPEA
jgi:hypothetical protein